MFVEHVNYPNQASLHRRMLPKIVSVLNSFISFTRSSIATRVNEAGLIETVPADQTQMDYDPITLAQNSLLIEESRMNVLIRYNEITDGWYKSRSTATDSTDFPIYFPTRGGFY